MKVLLLAAALVSSSAFANDLEAKKQEILTNIDQRITAIQGHRGCVQAAATEEALKTCMKSHKDVMKQLHKEKKKKKKKD